MAEEKETGFNPETNTHVLPEGVPDFDDYTEEDLQQDPELGLTDEEVAVEVAKLSEEDKKLYEQIKTFTDSSTDSTGISYQLQIGSRLPWQRGFPDSLPRPQNNSNS